MAGIRFSCSSSALYRLHCALCIVLYALCEVLNWPHYLLAMFGLASSTGPNYTCCCELNVSRGQLSADIGVA